MSLRVYQLKSIRACESGRLSPAWVTSALAATTAPAAPGSLARESACLERGAGRLASHGHEEARSTANARTTIDGRVKGFGSRGMARSPR